MYSIFFKYCYWYSLFPIPFIFNYFLLFNKCFPLLWPFLHIPLWSLDSYQNILFSISFNLLKITSVFISVSIEFIFSFWKFYFPITTIISSFNFISKSHKFSSFNSNLLKHSANWTSYFMFLESLYLKSSRSLFC